MTAITAAQLTPLLETADPGNPIAAMALVRLATASDPDAEAEAIVTEWRGAMERLIAVYRKVQPIIEPWLADIEPWLAEDDQAEPAEPEPVRDWASFRWGWPPIGAGS
jgi:hypothetical protein